MELGASGSTEKFMPCMLLSLRNETVVFVLAHKNDMSNSVISFYTPEESLRLINSKWKLTGQKFSVWKMHLDNVLRAQGKLYVLDKPVSRPKSNSPENEFTRLFKCLTRFGYKMTQEELVYLMWYSLPKEICDTTSAYMKEPKIDVAKVHEDILASLEPKPAPAELMDSDWIDELGDLSCPECGSQDIWKHTMNINQIEIGLPDVPATPVNGLYTVNLQDDNREIYHISKRSKDIEDQTYLWHCRLGHINKTRIELLLKAGFLGTFDFKTFDNCKSCLSGKMTKQPFNKDNERATDLSTDSRRRNTTPTVEAEIQHENVEPQSEPIEEVQTQDLRRSTRVRQEPDRYLGFLVSQDGGDLNEPTSYAAAMSGSESEQWQEAMEAEMQSMYDNQHCRAVGRKWVFKKKPDVDGNVHTFKARLVAKGFMQTHGIDYDETFSPVAMLKSIRILMAISAYFNYEIWQMDVKTAFLNGNLTEDVYMEQPEGFEDPKNPNKVCKLLKSIYGLKQASRSWNLHFDERIKEFGFAKSEFEPCVYTMFSGSIVTFLVLYVDDILLIGNDVPTLQSVKNWLSKCFQIKDLGEAAYILGIKIYRNRSKRLIGLSQSTYIDKILKKFRMDESKKGFIPMQHGIVLSKTQCPVSSQDQDKMKSVPYASAIGSIMYAMLWPDVAYSVSVTSRYQRNPGEPHWVAVKNILKYLRRTKGMFLVFGGSEDEISITGYSDASFQTDRDDFRSQSGYVFTLNGGAISWKSSKHDTIADSTIEAKYIAASDVAKEAVWLRNFLSDLRVVASISRPIDIFCDKSGAVALAKEPREHHKSRHVLRSITSSERSLEEEM
ncbi:hypothetical protein OSB04_001602 [Centaurea solstitialis]|uniref:Uncharacterized protein n=1 Tax=Centaurea solstitialis TaxID=347529 RepID=A0AA38U3X2_9ASTR|nr:hypothetical protein OSB04_001602 [Centaurea solstitialis]